MEYQIRACEEKDLHALVELCAKHAAFEQADYSSAGKLELLRKAILSDAPSLYCFVIAIAHQLKGYFSYTLDFSTWDAQKFLYLDCLYLEPEVRGHRIGEAVFVQLCAIAKQQQCINIQWQTPSFNERAIKFYHRIGGTGKNKVRFFIGITAG